jgi:hypothetical protein
VATVLSTGADPGFQVRGGGAHLKKLRRAEGGAKIFGVFEDTKCVFRGRKSKKNRPGVDPGRGGRTRRAPP